MHTQSTAKQTSAKIKHLINFGITHSRT